MSTQIKFKPVFGEVFLADSDGDFDSGLIAGENAPKWRIIAAFLTESAVAVDDLTPDEMARLQELITFVPLRSVITADHHEDRVDHDFEWHCDGTGARSLPCWWTERFTFEAHVDAIEQRLIDEAVAERSQS